VLRLRWPGVTIYMNTHSVIKALALSAIVSATASAQQPNVRHGQIRASDEDQYEERYVFLTGSNIPRKVKVRRHGTNGADNLSIYDQRDIRASGRATTEGALQTLDPSISVRRR
jgi:hypothetical protein